MTHTEFVTALYQSVLGREPDLAGLSHYVQALDDDLASVASVILVFLGSPEYQARLRSQGWAQAGGGAA